MFSLLKNRSVLFSSQIPKLSSVITTLLRRYARKENLKQKKKRRKTTAQNSIWVLNVPVTKKGPFLSEIPLRMHLKKRRFSQTQRKEHKCSYDRANWSFDYFIMVVWGSIKYSCLAYSLLLTGFFSFFHFSHSTNIKIIYWTYKKWHA